MNKKDIELLKEIKANPRKTRVGLEVENLINAGYISGISVRSFGDTEPVFAICKMTEDGNDLLDYVTGENQ